MPAQVDPRSNGQLATPPPPMREASESHHAAVHNPSALAPTGTLVLELWHSGGETDPIEGWEPSDFDPDRRVLAHYLIRSLLILAVVMGLAAAAWYFTGWQTAREASDIATLGDSAQRLEVSIVDLDLVVSDLEDGALADPSAATTALGDLNAAARDLFDVASGLQAESALRSETLTIAQQALDIESAIGDAISYGLAFELIASLPDWSADTLPEDVPAAAAEVAWWVGRFIDGASSLPGHALMTDHREQVAELAHSMEDWQVAYLDALRQGDRERAEKHLVEMELRLESLSGGWTDAAAEASAWGRSAIRDILDRIGALTPSG